jgi:hypothetical protein
MHLILTHLGRPELKLKCPKDIAKKEALKDRWHFIWLFTEDTSAQVPKIVHPSAGVFQGTPKKDIQEEKAETRTRP